MSYKMPPDAASRIASISWSDGHRPLIAKNCKQCQNEFETRSPHRRAFCDNVCQKRYYRAARKAAQAAALLSPPPEESAFTSE